MSSPVPGKEVCQGTGEPFVRLGTAAGRWVIAAAVLGSGIALLDGTVVNVALRKVGTDLDASMAELQWVVNAYLLTLAALILVGGALGDRFGRRRIFLVGVAWFGVASIICALAQSPDQLILARLVQGVGGALLTPGSLAIIQGSFPPAERGRVIGLWAGLGGIAAAIGPPLGGWVVDVATWRWIFWFNVPVVVVVLAIGMRHVPESLDPDSPAEYDVPGSVLAVLGLGGVTYALIESDAQWLGLGGLACLVAFVLVERRSPYPMMPLGLYRSRVFSVSNAMTLLVYGALGAMLFFLVLQLQVTAGYTPLQAGLATVPITIVMLLLSSRSGALASRIGPRLQMSVGPVVCGLGCWMLVGVGEGSGYWLDVLPGLTVFSLGLVCLVAPLTTSVLAAAPDRYAGVASGINNAVARTGSLLAVAALPALVGVSGEDYELPEVFTAGYERAMLTCAVLLVMGGAISFVGLAGSAAADGRR
jgi:EmrB/QacA subfamily drug resistance transporter